MRRNQGMYIDSVVFLKGNVTIGHIDATLVFGSPDRTSTAPVHQYCKLNPGERNRCPQNQSRLAHLPVPQFAEGLTGDQHMQ